MTDVLYVIAKAPRVGFAKTRLGKSIGHAKAIELYKAFLRDLGERFSDAPFGFGWYITPSDAWPEISALTGDTDRLLYQGEGDLTERQKELFQLATRRGERAVLIGSDAPHLSVVIIEEAFRALDQHDLVFLPTHDGGYCLIGMSGQHGDVLEGVTMSTGSELAGIIRRARLANLAVKFLEPTFDVDEVEDLQNLQELAVGRDDLANTTEVLKNLELPNTAPSSKAPIHPFLRPERKNV
ncbi:TIGR04282 family arsenosugar biosynthesis glycosyltransferase [soil metagenome]